MKNKHTPVMLFEAIDGLDIKPGRWYIDATFGLGGHTRAVLEKKAKVIAFDFDQLSIQAAQSIFKQEIEDSRLILIHDNFDQMIDHIKRLSDLKKVTQIQGILFDFGTNTLQLTSKDRGLSFSGSDEELDMRLDQRLGVKAKDLLALLSEKQLSDVFRDLGGETFAKPLAKAIVRQRTIRPIKTVSELVTIITKIKHRQGHLHPATKVFQALRILVNDELNNISRALPQALEILDNTGRIVTIAFHEGEDRLVKKTFLSWEEEKLGVIKTPHKKPITPDETELATNPNSRSAKMRIFEKI